MPNKAQKCSPGIAAAFCLHGLFLSIPAFISSAFIKSSLRHPPLGNSCSSILPQGRGQARQGLWGALSWRGGVGGIAVPPRMGEPLASQPPAAPKTTGGSRWAPAPSRGKWKAGRVLSTVSCAAGSFSCPAETAEERWEVTSASCAKRRSDDAMADTKAALTGPGHLPPSHARGIHGCRAAQSTRWDQRDGPGAAPAHQGAEEPRLLPGAALRCHRPGPAAPCGTGRKLCPVLALPWHG